VEPTQPYIQWALLFLFILGIKRPGREADTWLRPSASIRPVYRIFSVTCCSPKPPEACVVQSHARTAADTDVLVVCNSKAELG
jgi:hypothetical protein